MIEGVFVCGRVPGLACPLMDHLLTRTIPNNPKSGRTKGEKQVGHPRRTMNLDKPSHFLDWILPKDDRNAKQNKEKKAKARRLAQL